MCQEGLPPKMLCHGEHACFETPQGQVFSRFVTSIGSFSQFCLILKLHRVVVPFPPTFASPWQNSFVRIHGGTTLLKATFGTTSQKRPQNDLNWAVGSSYGTNKPPNPSFPYELRVSTFSNAFQSSKVSFPSSNFSFH